jgi:methionyl-tRNA synthetase
VAGAEGKKLYVWFDAPIGYISLQKNGREKVRMGTILEDQDTSWFTL